MCERLRASAAGAQRGRATKKVTFPPTPSLPLGHVKRTDFSPRFFCATPGSRSGGFPMENTSVNPEMSSAAGPTVPSSQLTSEQITVVAASFSSLVFFVIIVVLLSVIYHRDPHCCKLSSCQGRRSDMSAPPQYYSSRQMLVGSPGLETTQVPDDPNAQQAAQLFYVGLPSSYSLEAPLPRLPSYESVRKKDRQRQIHMMIADRFGLNGPIETEPPPTYEESVRQSVALPCDIIPPVTDASRPEGVCGPGSSVLPV